MRRAEPSPRPAAAPVSHQVRPSPRCRWQRTSTAPGPRPTPSPPPQLPHGPRRPARTSPPQSRRGTSSTAKTRCQDRALTTPGRRLRRDHIRRLGPPRVAASPTILAPPAPQCTTTAAPSLQRSSATRPCRASGRDPPGTRPPPSPGIVSQPRARDVTSSRSPRSPARLPSGLVELQQLSGRRTTVCRRRSSTCSCGTPKDLCSAPSTRPPRGPCSSPRRGRTPRWTPGPMTVTM
mmetsp:Transcript_75990/g.197746  ORF Transcript_75990/g.197746 Transcript_75990/m.197746 type:complete len:235 (-) Transcript_75990:688-1392(-)